MISLANSTVCIRPVYLRRNPARISEEELLKVQNITKVEGKDLYVYSGQSIQTTSIYRLGQVSVQEQGSYEIACLMDPRPGDKILDCCAAPGTKSFAMAERMNEQGSIDCLDLHAHRVKLIEQDARRLHISIVHPKQMDATNMEGLGLYDKILCDVPCSGYGILARKPDIKLRMKPEDMDTLIPLQRKILLQAVTHLRGGGILVYSTCTMNKKENEKQIEWLLSQMPNLVLEVEKTVFSNEEHDGFYMARLKKQRQDTDMPSY